MQESFTDCWLMQRSVAERFSCRRTCSPEVDRVCDRIAILRNGELVLLSAVDESLRLATRRVRVLFTEDVDLTLVSRPATKSLTGSRVWNLKVDGALGPLLRFIAAFTGQGSRN